MDHRSSLNYQWTSVNLVYVFHAVIDADTVSHRTRVAGRSLKTESGITANGTFR